MKNTFVLFGGTGGIGSALATLLLSSGDNVSIVSRSDEKLSTLPSGATGSVCDYSPESIESILIQTKEKNGDLTGVVNLSGSVLLKPAHLTTPQEFDAVMQTNVYTSFAILRAATKILSQSGGGSIVFCSSAAAQVGLANHEAIACAKGALIAMTRSAAATYAGKNIRINCIAPGLTKTSLTRRITTSDAGLKASLALHPPGSPW